MPDEHNITHSYIIDHIRSLLPERGGILGELELYASDHGVPIIQPEVAAFLSVMCSVHRPMRILEIGAAIGYSAMLMLDSCPDGAHITTIERDADMAQLMRENIERAGLVGRIDVLEADAVVMLPALDDEYDMIFMDAAKAHYITFLPDCIRLLRAGGLLIADNVLYGGMVSERKLLIRRKITIVKRLQKFLHAVCTAPELSTSVLSIGDGVTMSVRL